MNLLIIGPAKKSNRLLLAAARKRKHQARLANLDDFTYVLKNNVFRIFLKRRDISEFDAALIRGVNPHWGQAKTIAKYLQRHDKQVIDRELYRKVYEFDKLFMYAALSHHGLPCIDTWFFPSREVYKKCGRKFKFPLLVKDVQGMHGRNIFTEKNKKQLDEFLASHNVDDFLVQELIKSDYYLRVLVVGGRVLGAIKRFTLQHLAREYVNMRERSIKHSLTPAERKLALAAARAVNADIAGVDVIYDQAGKPYILEVNRCPEFTCFTRTTGIDAAAEIIKFVEEIETRI